MGDISAEPSMEEILSSIKRIIAEEGEGGQVRQRRPQRAAPPASAASEDEVLELSEPIGAPPSPSPEPAPAPARAAAPASPGGAVMNDTILSTQAVAATRGSLEALSRMVVRPEPDSDGTLEGLVRDMLRPMLREWLDTNLPAMVEDMVSREIAKITTAPR